MSISRLTLHLPAHSRPASLPWLEDLPAPEGRRQPNGGILVTDTRAPALIYKFTPWEKSGLATNELAIAARLRQAGDLPGILRMEAVGGSTDHLVRAMKLAPLGTLEGLLRGWTREGRHAAPALTRKLLGQIAGAMAALHGLGILHRDLKAENVLLLGDGDAPDAMLADFDRAVELPEGARLTEPVGSLFHMAPELLANLPYGAKVDVYAFGILAFEVLHGGARPYENVATGMPGSLTRADFSAQVMARGLRPAWQHPDPDLRDLAMACWAADPDDRPDFTQILARLNAAPVLPPKPAEAPQLRIGSAASIGMVRRTMEDAAIVLHRPHADILGVFDGFRGARSSTVAARQLGPVLAHGLRLRPDDPEGAMRRAFAQVDLTLSRLDPTITCGSTATVAVMDAQHIHLAWLGDSPAWLFRQGQSEVEMLPLIRSHGPNRADEAARIQAAGGEIRQEMRWLDSGEAVPWGPMRVYAPASGAKNGIALSRALGLPAYRPVISAEPETTRITRGPEDLFLVLGSDGVFDILTPQRLYEILCAAPHPQAAAEAVIAAVEAGGAPDNATVIVADLRA